MLRAACLFFALMIGLLMASGASAANAPRTLPATEADSTRADGATSSVPAYPPSASSATRPPSATPTITPTFSLAITPAASVDLSGAPENVLVALHTMALVPAGGRELFDVPTGYAITSDPGYSFLGLGQGSAAQNFVLGFQMIWYTAGVDSACGLSFRMTDNGLSSIFLTNDGNAILTQQQDKITLLNYKHASDLFLRTQFNTVLLIALDDRLLLYINGKLETSVTAKSVRGGFALNLYNALDNHVVTECRYRRIWIWTLDSDPKATPT